MGVRACVCARKQNKAWGVFFFAEVGVQLGLGVRVDGVMPLTSSRTRHRQIAYA